MQASLNDTTGNNYLTANGTEITFRESNGAVLYVEGFGHVTGTAKSGNDTAYLAYLQSFDFALTLNGPWVENYSIFHS